MTNDAYFFYARDCDLPNIDESAVGPTSLSCTQPLTHAEVAKFPGQRLEKEMRKMSGHIAAATCAFLVMVGEFDARKLWAEHECNTCADWLSWRCGISIGTARDQVRVARKLRSLPQVTEEFSNGRLSYSKTRAICRVATRNNEDQWIRLAGNATAKILDHMASAWSKSKDNWLDEINERNLEETQAEKSERLRSLTWLMQPNGDMMVKMRIPAGVGVEIFENAIERCLDNRPSLGRNRDGTPEEPPNEFYDAPDRLACRRLDALIDALVMNADCEASLAPPADITICHHTMGDTTGRALVEANNGDDNEQASNTQENVSAETPAGHDYGTATPTTEGAPTQWFRDLHRPSGDSSLSITKRGLVMTPTMMELLSCDAGVRQTAPPWQSEDDEHKCCSGEQHDHGQTDAQHWVHDRDPQRHPKPAMRRKIFARDGGTCQFPSCQRRHRLAAHHIIHWAAGGRTELENLILLCPKHHHAVHDRSWKLEGTASQPVFKRPDGSVVTQVPPMSAGNLNHLIRTHEAQSIEVTPSSASGTWYGESIDWGCFFAAFPINPEDWMPRLEHSN